MYFDVIIEKMITGIFIVINNKTEEGYIYCFKYIKEYIFKLNKNIKTPLKIILLQPILKLVYINHLKRFSIQKIILSILDVIYIICKIL